LDDYERLSDFLKKAEAYAKEMVEEFRMVREDLPNYSSLLEKISASLKEARAGGLPGHMIEACVRENFPACFISTSRSPTTDYFQYSSLSRYCCCPIV
jgi:hypothetical protein